MDMKKNIKKIVAVGTGIVMLGATIFGASAGAGADLNNYPNFLGSSVLVVGANAASEDVIGAIDIAVSLSKENQAVSSEGNPDSVEFEKSNNFLELGENLGSVRNTLTSDDLPFLAGGELRSAHGRAEYSQYLRVGDNEASVDYAESEDEVVGDFLVVKEGEYLFEYELQFQAGFDSDLDDGKLEDLEGEDLVFMGKSYNVMDAELDGDVLSLTLMTGSVEDVLFEGESKVYNVDGKEYDVKVLIISDSTVSVKFVVNGEVTDKLSEGDSYRLVDGTELVVKEIMSNEGTEVNGADIVEFYLGAGKLELSDDYSDNEWSEDVELDEDRIDNAEVRILGSLDGDEFSLASIEYRLAFEADDDAYVSAGGLLSDSMDNEEGLFGLDFLYEGLDRDEASELKITSSGDDAYKLSFVNLKGASYNFPLVDTSEDFKMGTDDENLAFEAGTDIFKRDLFILSDGSDDEADSYVLEYESVDKGDELIRFSDLEGSRYEISFAGGDGELIIGGTSFAFEMNEDYSFQIDHDGDGNLEEGNAVIVLRGGAVLELEMGESGLSLSLTTTADKFDDDEGDEVISIYVSDEGDELDLSVEGVDLFRHEDNDDLESGMSLYGVKLELEDKSGSPTELVLSYPEVQAKARVSLLGPGFSALSSAPRVDVGSAILDSELGSYSGNMIVIGGPCANAEAAKLLGNPEDCTDGFKEGEAIIKLFERDGNYALLVAGFSAADTRRAAKVLADYKDYDLKGTEVRVSGTTDTDISVASAELD